MSVRKSKAQERSNMRTSPYQIAGDVTQEVWRPVVGYAGYYVSDHGRVCSVDREVKGKLCRGRILRPGPANSGHLTVSMGRLNSKSVHALVLQAFIGPCPHGHEALHFDDNPANNALTNLRWGTRLENIRDAFRNGGRVRGEKLTNSKLTDEGVRWIRANAHCSMNSLAHHLGVSCAAVKQVRDGITWKHVR